MDTTQIIVTVVSIIIALGIVYKAFTLWKENKQEKSAPKVEVKSKNKYDESSIGIEATPCQFDTEESEKLKKNNRTDSENKVHEIKVDSERTERLKSELKSERKEEKKSEKEDRKENKEKGKDR